MLHSKERCSWCWDSYRSAEDCGLHAGVKELIHLFFLLLWDQSMKFTVCSCLLDLGRFHILMGCFLDFRSRIFSCFVQLILLLFMRLFFTVIPSVMEWQLNFSVFPDKFCLNRMKRKLACSLPFHSKLLKTSAFSSQCQNSETEYFWLPYCQYRYLRWAARTETFPFSHYLTGIRISSRHYRMEFIQHSSRNCDW